MYTSTYMAYLGKSKFADKRHERGYQGLGEEGDEKLLFNRCRVSVWDDENIVGDSLDGCTTL